MAGMTATLPTLGAVAPSREEFRALAAGHRVIPVTRRLLADDETPVGVYRKLAGDRPGTFLFESAENGRSWSRWSFVGARSAATLTAVDGELVWTGEVPGGLPDVRRPAGRAARVVDELHSERLPGLPPLTGGMVGYLGYDVVRRLERLPELAEDDLQLPRAGDAARHRPGRGRPPRGHVTLIANALNWDASDERVDEAYDDAVARLDRMTAELAAPAPSTVAVYGSGPPEFRRRAPRRSTTRRSRRRRSRSARARRSRWWCRSGSRPTARPTRSTSTACCAPPTPARTCTCCGWPTRPGRSSRSSARAPRPW
jgi:anthranilate synthase component 1